jgi:hypothetical protein
VLGTDAREGTGKGGPDMSTLMVSVFKAIWQVRRGNSAWREDPLTNHPESLPDVDPSKAHEVCLAGRGRAAT